ncbi:hypothetical protein, partial [Rhodopseudomonas palustris]
MGSGAQPLKTANDAVRLVRGGEEDPLLPRLLAAIIGSSNISKEALTQGLEWNYWVEAGSPDSDGPQRLAEIRDAFRQTFQHSRTRALDYGWVDEYERRRPDTPPSVAPGSDDPELPL